MERDDIRDWPSVSVAAKRAGVSVVSIYAAIDRGQLRIVKTALGCLVNPDDLARYRPRAYMSTRRKVEA